MAGDGIAILPVVKADAYGHGMVPVARALAAAGADGLCVATLDEAIVLRDGGVDGSDPRALPDPAEWGRRRRRSAGSGSPAATASALGEMLAAAVAAGVADRLSIELEVETGLGRGGVPPDDVVDVARRILAAVAPGSAASGRTSRRPRSRT